MNFKRLGRGLLRIGMKRVFVSATIALALIWVAPSVYQSSSARPLSAASSKSALASFVGVSGYNLVGSDGAVYPFNVHSHGSLVGTKLNKPIVASASTPDGLGYWLVASDGGVFSFGDAGYYGSTGAMTLNKPIVGMASTPDGKGYWLVASDGGIFSFGDAAYYGSTGAMTLNKPIVGMASTPDGRGYWLVASDGGIFSFGDAAYYGSTGAMTLNKPIVGMAASQDGLGYWLVASDGGIFSFGDATYYGSAAGTPVSAPVVGIAAVNIPTAYSPGATGYDVSNFQCSALPPTAPLAIVEATGWSFSYQNPCLAQEAQWAGQNLSLYAFINWPSDGTNSPTNFGSPSFMTGPAGNCAATDLNCQAYNFGFKQAQYSYQYAQTSNVSSPNWWLDVETSGQWAATTQGPNLLAPAAQAQDYQDILGAINFFKSVGVAVGVYSTPRQWGQITGGAILPANTQIWVALPGVDPSTACSASNSFGGGQVVLVQTGSATINGHTYDTDLTC